MAPNFSEQLDIPNWSNENVSFHAFIRVEFLCDD